MPKPGGSSVLRTTIRENVSTKSSKVEKQINAGSMRKGSDTSNESLNNMTREKALELIYSKSHCKRNNKSSDERDDVYLDFPNKFDCLSHSSFSSGAQNGVIQKCIKEVYMKWILKFKVAQDSPIDTRVILSVGTPGRLSSVSGVSGDSEERIGSSDRSSGISRVTHPATNSTSNSGESTLNRTSESSSTCSNSSAELLFKNSKTPSSILQTTSHLASGVKKVSIVAPQRRVPVELSAVNERASDPAQRDERGAALSGSDTSRDRAHQATLEKQSKKRNILRIVIPKEISSISGIKPLSATEARRMEEAIELANSLSLMSAHEQHTPQTPGTASLSSSLESPSSQKWFNFKKKFAKEEKKSYVDEMNNSPNAVLTQEALEAYNSLVDQNHSCKTVKRSSDVSVTLFENCQQKSYDTHRHRGTRNRNSLSESEKSPRSAKDSERSVLCGKHPAQTKLNTSSLSRPTVFNFNSLTKNANISDHLNRNVHCSADNDRGATVSRINSNGSASDATPVNSTPSAELIADLSPVLTPEVEDDAIQQITRRPFIQRSISMFENGSNMEDSLNKDSNKDLNRNVSQFPVITECDQMIAPPLPIKEKVYNESKLQNVNIDKTELRILEPSDLAAEIKSMNEIRVKNIELADMKSVRDHMNPSCTDYENILPPPLPPRQPLRQSTVNNPPPCRRYPLPSDPVRSRTLSEVVPSSRERALVRQTSCQVTARAGLVSSQSNSFSSCSESEENVFSVSLDSAELRALGDYKDVSSCSSGSLPGSAHTGLAQSCSGGFSGRVKRREFSYSAKDVALKARDLGINDKADLFWVQAVNFYLSQSVPTINDQSRVIRPRRKNEAESRGLEDGARNRVGGEEEDGLSYEGLLEGALEEENNRKKADNLCDEIKLMKKVLSNDVSVDECMEALEDTRWNIQNAIKLIKLKQLMSAQLADKQQCKQALLFARWDVQAAAEYLLAPPERRQTPDLVFNP